MTEQTTEETWADVPMSIPEAIDWLKEAQDTITDSIAGLVELSMTPGAPEVRGLGDALGVREAAICLSNRIDDARQKLPPVPAEAAPPCRVEGCLQVGTEERASFLYFCLYHVMAFDAGEFD